MFASVLVLPLSAALAALAAPTQLAARTESPSYCGISFGPGAYNVAYNFTLGAANTTGTVNYTDPGIPLVLTTVASNNSFSRAVLTTATSATNLFPTYSLLNGSLVPNASEPGVSAVDLPVSVGGLLGFEYASGATASQLPAPVEIYCSVADTDPAGGYLYPALLVDGSSDFSLCIANGSTAVVFQAVQDNGGEYDFDGCYPVRVQSVSPL